MPADSLTVGCTPGPWWWVGIPPHLSSCCSTAADHQTTPLSGPSGTTSLPVLAVTNCITQPVLGSYTGTNIHNNTLTTEKYDRFFPSRINLGNIQHNCIATVIVKLLHQKCFKVPSTVTHTCWNITCCNVTCYDWHKANRNMLRYNMLCYNNNSKNWGKKSIKNFFKAMIS